MDTHDQKKGEVVLVSESRELLTELPPGQIILFEQYRLIRRTWWWVLLLAILVSAATWYYVTWNIEPEFMATAVSVPPRKSGTPLDNLIGDVGGGLKSFSLSKLIGKRGVESGYTTFSVMTSDAVKDSLVAKYNLYDLYEVPRSDYPKVLGELDSRMEFENDLEGPISVSIYDTDPERAASMANDVIRYTNGFLQELNRQETEPITKFIEKRYDQLKAEQGSLAAKMQEYMARTSIYEPESQLSATATALIEARVNESSQRAVVNMMEQMLGADDPGVAQQKTMLRELEAERRRLEGGTAGVGPSVNALPSALVEYAKLKQDYEVNAQLVAIVEPMYQQTIFDEQRDIPQLLFLHEATPPVKKARPRRSIALASAFLGTIIISYLMIAFVAWSRSLNERYRAYRKIVDQEVRLQVQKKSSSST
ncbi:MAG: hypothetical protein KDD67_04345 [Ignavibacteriae bacterium]|nr:hypothetical protein [Ignavibacteriota bacterium]MCB9217037.1 hypothetical protein [Ignavibacteria bacterium]